MAVKGIRESARNLAFSAVFAYDQGGTNLEELARFDWYKAMQEYDDEGHELLTIQDNVKEETFLQAREMLLGTFQNIEKIDQIIKKYLVKWDFNRVKSVDKAILRISVYSILFRSDMPSEVIIAEANDLADIYSEEAASNYINGMLHKIKEEIRDKKQQTLPEKAPGENKKKKNIKLKLLI